MLTGSWVSVGTLRVAAVAAGAPLIQDAVVAGHDRDEIGLLIFLNSAAAAEAVGRGADTPACELVTSEKLRAALGAALAAYNVGHSGSSQRIARALLLSEPPDIDANEITDKGYINQRAVLDRRSGLVETLFSDDPRVILIG